MRSFLCSVVVCFSLSGGLFADMDSFEDFGFFIKINGLISYPWGELIRLENESWELSVMYGNGRVLSSKPTVTKFGFDAGIELKFKRLGIPINYQFTVYSETVSVGDGDSYENVSYSGTLLYLHSVNSGIHYYFGLNDDEEWSQYGAWYVGLLTGMEYAHLLPYPSLAKFAGVTTLDSWGLIGVNVGPTLGYNYIYNVFLIGISATARARFLWTPDSLSDYYPLENFVGLGDISVCATVGLAF